MSDSGQPHHTQVPPGMAEAAAAPTSLAVLEWRISAVEARQLDLRSFREDVTKEFRVTGTKTTFLHEQGAATRRQLEEMHEQGAATRRQLEEMQSRMTAFGVELHQGLPQLTAQVQANAQELAAMQETSRIFM